MAQRSTQKVYLNDIGTKIKLDAQEDITTATLAQIRYRTPSGKTGLWVGAVEDTTFVTFITVDGTLNEVGMWKVQIYVELLDGWKGRGETVTFTVYDSFK